MGRKIDLRLCAITQADMVPNRPLEQAVLSAIRGGASSIQYREKRATLREKYKEAAALSVVMRSEGVPFIVNDHVDLALAVSADGVHLGQDDLPPDVARRVMGEGPVIGVSVGSVAEAVEAERAGADYVSVGPMYPTETKRDAGEVASHEVVKEIIEAVRIPVVAVGGINAANVTDVMSLGVHGVAVISAIMGAPDPMLASREISDKINAILSGREK